MKFPLPAVLQKGKPQVKMRGEALSMGVSGKIAIHFCDFPEGHLTMMTVPQIETLWIELNLPVALQGPDKEAIRKFLDDEFGAKNSESVL